MRYHYVALELLYLGTVTSCSRTTLEGVTTEDEVAPDVAVPDADAACAVDICTPGETMTTTDGCPASQRRTRTCSAVCEWGPFDACVGYGWLPIASPESVGFEGRLEAVSVWTGREMLVWGGRLTLKGDERPRHEGAAYDPTTNRWRLLPASPIGHRLGDVTAVWTGSAMLLWSGSDTFSWTSGASEPLPDGAAFDPVTNAWSRIPSAPIGGRGAVRGGWLSSTRELVVWGGAVGTRTFRDGAAYSPATNTWRMLREGHLTSRAGHALIAANGRMIVAGGWSGEWSAPSDGSIYEPVKESWFPVFDTLPVSGAHAGADGDLAVVFGGYLRGISALGGRVYRASTGESFTIPPAPETLLRLTTSNYATTWVGAGRLWVWNSFWAAPDRNLVSFELATSTWTRMPDVPLDRRFRSSIVWTGREAMIWGGCCVGEEVDGPAYADGALYRP